MLCHTTTIFVNAGEVNNLKGMDHHWHQVDPMDDRGYFNFGPNSSEELECFLNLKVRVVEVNKNMPVCYGGVKEAIHISQIDYIVEAPDDQEIFAVPELPKPTEADIQIAKNLLEYIHDGDCIQLGIGAMPNAVGQLIADSDLKDNREK
ncbi:hypothetical protein [Thermosyntropha sp.]|uniref:hypothetical protein n=1 Tax=Thermosyntropha sp. TaxID=2740820 RepID=UPI0025DC718F|nr:hypothetical protein [Thermosyntropha sp.]MBO8159281.1 hypothetical protein [Thermosyntropha sp.]